MSYPLTWDNQGERWFEMGVDHGVLYPYNSTTGKYKPGVAWNGLTSVSDSPEGGDPNDLWADNMKYASLRAAETLKGTIEAYMYPEEFAVLDGTVKAANGIYFGQQKRGKFGLCYRSKTGNDTDNEAGYKLHLIYGCSVSPSEKQYETINDSPDAITFSWEFDANAVPVNSPVAGESIKPVASITIDSTKVDAAVLSVIEAKLYGTSGEGNEAELPTPDEILEMLGGNYTYTYSAVSSAATGYSTTSPKLSGWYEREEIPESDPTEYNYFKSQDVSVVNGKTYYTLTVTTAA